VAFLLVAANSASAEVIDFTGLGKKAYLADPQTKTVGWSDGFTNGVVNSGAKAAWLFNTFAGTIHASGTRVQAAALQVAIATVLDTQHGQDQVTSRVSEPSTLLLLGAGLAFVARRARRVQSRV
jgi:PEP-CTERM motif